MEQQELVKEKLAALTEEFIAADKDHFLVDVKLMPGKVQVFVDADNGIMIDKCAEISRHLEKYLDESLVLGEKYVLEVSSPGMSSPLKVLRQYKRRIGREVDVVKTDGVKITGILKTADNEGITIEEQLKKKQKVVDTKHHSILFKEIKSTKLKFNF